MASVKDFDETTRSESRLAPTSSGNSNKKSVNKFSAKPAGVTPFKSFFNLFYRYKLKCMFTPKLVPLNFSVTIFLYINSTRKKFVEEIRFQVKRVDFQLSKHKKLFHKFRLIFFKSRYVPARYCQKIEIPVQTPTRRFVSFLFVECSPTKETVVELKPPFIH